MVPNPYFFLSARSVKMEFASAVFFKNENPRISFHWINNAFVENLFGRIPLDFRVFLKIRWIVFECRTRFSKIQRILIFFEWNFFFPIRWIWKIGEKAQYLKSSGFGIFVTKILQSSGIPLFAGLTERWKKPNTAQCIPAEFACFFSKIRWIYCYRNICRRTRIFHQKVLPTIIISVPSLL